MTGCIKVAKKSNKKQNHPCQAGINTIVIPDIADNILNKSGFKKLKKERCATFDGDKEKEFEDGKLSLEDMRTYAIENGEPAVKSDKQEL